MTPLPGPLNDPSNPAITLPIGFAVTWTFNLLDDQDQPESLAGATEVILNILETLEDSGPLIQKSSAASSLTIGANSISVPFTGSDTSLFLTPGAYIGQFQIEIGGQWYVTDPFEVRASQVVGGAP